MILCKFYIIGKIQIIINLNYKGTSSFSRMNTCSLLKNFEELEYLIDKAKITANICWSSRRLGDIFKTCLEDVFNMSSS